MAATIQLRRDLLVNWETDNPIIALGEMVLILDINGDTIATKVGNGTDAFVDLPDFGGAGGGVTTVTALVAPTLELFNSIYFVIGDKAYLATSNLEVPLTDLDVFWVEI